MFDSLPSATLRTLTMPCVGTWMSGFSIPRCNPKLCWFSGSSQTDKKGVPAAPWTHTVQFLIEHTDNPRKCLHVDQLSWQAARTWEAQRGNSLFRVLFHQHTAHTARHSKRATHPTVCQAREQLPVVGRRWVTRRPAAPDKWLVTSLACQCNTLQC